MGSFLFTAKDLLYLQFTMIKKLLSKLGVKRLSAHVKAGAQSEKQFKKLPKRLDQLDDGYRVLARELAKR